MWRIVLRNSQYIGDCLDACGESVAALGRAPHYSGSTRAASVKNDNGGFLPKAATLQNKP